MKKIPLILAPMAGSTDRAFRELCREYGADSTVSEMISAKAVYFGDKKTISLASFGESERPYSLQLFGSEPEAMEYAAKTLCAAIHPDAIDINMGCPVPKIVKNGDGSALMRNQTLAERVVRAAVTGADVPVTVKMRTGWNGAEAEREETNAVGLARACERAGAAGVTIHARTREEGYRRGINLGMITAVKRAVSIPVTGNGDIDSPESASEMLKKTGCDALMIGRAAIGCPWIFASVKAALNNESFSPPPLSEVMRRHIELEFRYKSPEVAARELRRHIAAYIRGYRGAAAMRDRVNHIETEAELYQLVDELCEINDLSEKAKNDG